MRTFLPRRSAAAVAAAGVVVVVLSSCVAEAFVPGGGGGPSIARSIPPPSSSSSAGGGKEVPNPFGRVAGVAFRDASAAAAASSSGGGGRRLFVASSSQDVDSSAADHHHRRRPKKSSEDVDFITSGLSTAYSLSEFTPADLSSLVSSFESVYYSDGHEICRQGDAGDYFYIVRSGNVRFEVDGNAVGNANEGETFGELALLDGNSRRAATAIAEDKDEEDGEGVSLWRVDGSTFRAVLGEQTKRNVDFIRRSLSFSYVFDKIADPELGTLVQSFQPIEYPRGAAVMRQGDGGDYFYIVQSGEVKFEVDGNEVGTAGEGRTFGELALVDESSRRAATVTAYGGPVRLFRLDRSAFRAVLGETKLNDVDVYSRRVELKKKLEEAAVKSIGLGDDDLPVGYAEEVMESMEKIRPIARPAYHPSMNGEWCMVKAGVNTLDMTLITVLSKISAAFPFLVDFTDCYITLSNQATLVTCNIYLKLFFGSVPFKMEAYTALECDDSHPDGTLMYEAFQGASVLGIDLPIPNLAVARPLEITYLDEDIMLARNDGGEPHLLVRIKSSAEEDPDHEFTGFFEQARELYGDRITRCLVDKYYGQDSREDKLKKALEKAKSLSVSNTRDRLNFLD